MPKENPVQEHLLEKVMYDGVLVTRGEMIADLQKIAKLQFPKDKLMQVKVVNAYLAGKTKRD